MPLSLDDFNDNTQPQSPTGELQEKVAPVVDKFLNFAGDAYDFGMGVVKAPAKIFSEAYDYYKQNQAYKEYEQQAPILSEQVKRGEITREQYLDQLDAIMGERSLATLQLQFQNKKITPEEYGIAIREFAEKNDKPLWDVGQTLIGLYGASKIPLKVLNTIVAGTSTARLASGEDPEVVGSDLGKLYIYRQAFKLGTKTIGRVVEGAQGNRINSATGSREHAIIIDPKKTDIKALLIKVRSGSFTSPDEQKLAQAITDQIRVLGIKRVLNKPFKIWTPVQTDIPATPAALLEDRTKKVAATVDALERKIDLGAKSPQAIAAQLKQTAKLGTPQDVKGKEALAKYTENLRLKEASKDAYAKIIYDSPEAVTVRNLREPNAAKDMLKAIPKAEMKIRGTGGEIAGAAHNLKNLFDRGLLNNSTLTAMIDGTKNQGELLLNNEPLGPMSQNLDQPIYLATRNSIKLAEQINTELGVVAMNAPKNYDTFIETFENKQFSWPQKINILAHAENYENRMILNRSGISESIISQMVNSLTDNDITALNAIRAHFNVSLPNLIKPAVREIRGAEPTIPVAPVGDLTKEQYANYLKEIPNNKELSGYGAPRFYEEGKGTPIFQNRIQELIEEVSDGSIGRPAIKAKLQEGFLKQRKEGVNIPLKLDLFDNLQKHAKDVAKYAYLGPTLHRTGRYFKKIESELTTQYGAEITNSIRDWMNDLLIGAPATFGEWDKKIDEQRMLAYAFTLTRNPIKIALMQTASAPNAMSIVGVQNYQSALDEVLSNPTVIEDIRNESPIMRTRFAHITQADMMDVLSSAKNTALSKLKKGQKEYVQIMTVASNVMDKVTASAAYLAAKRLYLERNPNATNEEAAIVAERATGASQPMTQEFFRPAALRRNPITKQILLYNTQRVQVYNRLVENQNNFNNKNINYGEYIKNIMMHYVIPVTQLLLISSAFVPLSKQAKTPAEKGLAWAKVALGSLPALSQVVGALEYNEGSIQIGSFAHIAAAGKYALKTVKSKNLIEGTANAIQASLALFGNNLQVPKNITAFARSVMDNDPQFKRIFMSDYEAGYMDITEEMSYMKRELKKDLPKRPTRADLLRDPWEEILK